MSRGSKEAIAKLARRVYADPTSAKTNDAIIMARALLLLIEGRLP